MFHLIILSMVVAASGSLASEMYRKNTAFPQTRGDPYPAFGILSFSEEQTPFSRLVTRIHAFREVVESSSLPILVQLPSPDLQNILL
ncbi:hypothetical protein AOQ84DRAFT_215572 [Glonium stellatum]|uniref:Uncharacterized protein n=1 Tax=Glonium stellatum TaxID=574774 RepID=A0A8E2F529_9PEZI|nr:hypothetical protein AOQ84DRAFT_215572 [Glonium stellatum]